MNINSALESTHNLKKVTYRMLKKLHKLEKRDSLKNTAKFGDEYCVVLYLSHMVNVIENAYKGIDNAERVIKYLLYIINYLIKRTKADFRIHRVILVSCLHKHTYVFNWLKEKKIKVMINNDLVNLWSLRCVPAYVGQFGNKI